MPTPTLLVYLTLASPPGPVELVLSSRHGNAPHLASQQTVTALQTLRVDPATYLPQLLELVDADILRAQDTPTDEVYRRMNALILAIDVAGTTHQEDALERLFLLREQRVEREEIHAQLTAEIQEGTPAEELAYRAREAAIERLAAPERAALVALANRGDDALVDDLVARLSWDRGMQAASIRYLAAVAPDRPQVKEAVGALAKKSTDEYVLARIELFFPELLP